MELSYIIVTCNRDYHISSCLDSLPGTAGPMEYEVIIVDNHSMDEGLASSRNGTPM